MTLEVQEVRQRTLGLQRKTGDVERPAHVRGVARPEATVRALARVDEVVVAHAAPQQEDRRDGCPVHVLDVGVRQLDARRGGQQLRPRGAGRLEARIARGCAKCRRRGLRMDVDRRLDPHVALLARGHLEVVATRELEAAELERRLERVQLRVPGVRRQRLQALAERRELKLERLARGLGSAGGRRGGVREHVDAVVEHEEVAAPSEVARARELAQRVERPSLPAQSNPHRDAAR